MFQAHLSLDLVSSSNHLPREIPPDILPDLRSPDSILKDVHEKEILVAKAFNLEDILLNITKEHEKEGMKVVTFCYFIVVLYDHYTIVMINYSYFLFEILIWRFFLSFNASF